MRINKILIVLLFPLIAEVVVSCCDCADPSIGHYAHKAIVVENIDNSGGEPVTTTANSVPKAAFGIRAELTRERTTFLTPTKSLFVTSAYATSCDCPPPNQLFGRDSVTAIEIFTVNAFDASHPANSDVSAYFSVFRGTTFNTIGDYLKKHPTVVYSESELAVTFDALLMTPPSLNLSHSFKIKVTLSDGRTLEGITTSINLL